MRRTECFWPRLRWRLFLLLACGSATTAATTTVTTLVVPSPGSKNLIVDHWILGPLRQEGLSRWKPSVSDLQSEPRQIVAERMRGCFDPARGEAVFCPCSNFLPLRFVPSGARCARGGVHGARGVGFGCSRLKVDKLISVSLIAADAGLV